MEAKYESCLFWNEVHYGRRYLRFYFLYHLEKEAAAMKFA